MSSKMKKVSFDETLSEDDYGLIVSKDGVLKGIWIPDAIDDHDNIPENIAKLCVDYFKFNPNGDSLPSTVH